jgi:hypothetical protein
MEKSSDLWYHKDDKDHKGWLSVMMIFRDGSICHAYFPPGRTFHNFCVAAEIEAAVAILI